MGDVVEEESPHPPQERPVDSRNSTSEEGPLFVAVIRDCRVGVMKICQHYDPMI